MEQISQTEFEAGVSEIKNEFKLMLIKRKDLVLRLGRLCEKFLKDKNSICEEIKIILREYIQEHLISERRIEAYCLPAWKNVKQSDSGRKGAESQSEKRTTAAKVAAVMGNSDQVTITDHDDEDDVPDGKILVDKDDYELLRKRAAMLNSEASQANVELVQTRDQLMQARMLIDGLHETIKKLRSEKDQEKQGRGTQTTLDKFMPAFKKIVETAHSEKCPAGCRTWHAAHKIALPAQ